MILQIFLLKSDRCLKAPKRIRLLKKTFKLVWKGIESIFAAFKLLVFDFRQPLFVFESNKQNVEPELYYHPGGRIRLLLQFLFLLS